MKNLSFVNLLSVTLVGSSASGFLCLALLDASIKSLILLVLSSIACLLLIRASAATRHLVWTAAMIGLLLMPACTFLLPAWRVLPVWLSLESRIEREHTKQIPTVANNNTLGELFPPVQPPQPIDYLQGEAKALPSPVSPPWVVPSASSPIQFRLRASILIGIWGTGCLLCLLPVAFAFLRLHQMESHFKNNKPMPARLEGRISKIACKLGIAVPRVLLGPTGSMPMVWTVWESRLFLPSDAEQWSTPRLNAVLLHELVHLKRRDPTWFLVALFGRSVNWFNPLAWFAVHRLRIECERACDDQVLRMGVEASDYATHLLALSTSVRALTGTGSIALAMSSKPNVENRILSILNEKVNRRGVTLRRAVCVLTFVSLGVAALATLTATTTEIASTNKPDSKVETQYPYCVIDVDGLEARPLSEAITAFNKQSQESPTGIAQPPITEQETLSAIAEFIALAHVSEPTKATLREIEKTKILPANAYFRRFTRFDDEQQMQGVWWVRLFVELDAPPMHSVPIRTTPIFARPYTQMERQQNAENGLTLINRFVSYFEQPPVARLNDDFPKDAAGRLTGLTWQAIRNKDTTALKELFHWQDASDSTRAFVTSELQSLLKSTVHSIKIQPRTLDGNLLHWSAFQYFQPNLPVVGYLEIEVEQREPPPVPQDPLVYEIDNGDMLMVRIDRVLPNEPSNNSAVRYPIVVQGNGTIALPSIEPIVVTGKSVEQINDLIKKAYLDAKIFTNPAKLNAIVTVELRQRGPTKKLSLEFGKLGDEFRLVNYVTQGEQNLPKALVPGLSMRGNTESQADGSYLLTNAITNPGSLLSAHLANEEIRQRDLENNRK